MTTIIVNNQKINVDAAPDTPLLWVLRDHLGMTGTKFGCGMALCGACTVHIDGAATRSCVLPLSAAEGRSITTIEGLSADRGHAVQKAWLELDVPQCGYCQSGTDHVGGGASPDQPQAQRCRHRCGHVRQHMPLRHLSANPQGDSSCGGTARLRCRAVRPASDLSRRDFLNAGAMAGGGFLLALTLPGPGGRANSAAAGAAGGAASAGKSGGQLNAWLKIARDNSITIIVDRSEMGQGVYTALPMLLAEELDIDMGVIRIEAAPVGDAYVNPGNGGQVTGTSNSVQDAWEKLRTAGAAARTMLISAAAKHWRVDAAQCHARNGTVVNARGQMLTYGELADAAAKEPVPKAPKLKAKGDFRLVGKSQARIDTPGKVGRQCGVRPRRQAARHAPRRAGAMPGIGRKGKDGRCRRRRTHAGRTQGHADLHRSRGGGRSFLAGIEGPPGPGHRLG